MRDLEILKTLAVETGFTHVTPLNIAAIKLRQEVREMCATNSCGQYGKNWSCPPACGELQELEEKLTQYQNGLLLQTVGALDDPFDFDGMMDTEKLHKEMLFVLQSMVQKKYPQAFVIGVGCCTNCRTCTYPDEPCRMPDKKIVSMEAYGMLVNEVCSTNQMKYYYGPNTIAYTSCLLVE